MSGIYKGHDLTVIPPRSLRPIAAVIAHGNRKYREADWLARDSRDDLRAVLGHVLEHLAGSDIDSSSGESHLAHAAARLLFVLERQERGFAQHAWRPFTDRGVPPFQGMTIQQWVDQTFVDEGETSADDQD